MWGQREQMGVIGWDGSWKPILQTAEKSRHCIQAVGVLMWSTPWQ